MRIVCEQCQTTYIVPDDKIVKNVLRLTCQKCGHVITTRVEKTENPPNSTLGKWQKSGVNTPSRLQNESPSWYYSIDGESIGPFTEIELKNRLLTDKMAPKLEQCYIWRKSFSEWKPVLEVEPFASALLMPPPPPPPVKPPPKSDANLPPLFTGTKSSGSFEIGKPKSSPDLPGLKQRLQSSNGLLLERQRASLAKLAGVPENAASVNNDVPTHPGLPVVDEFSHASEEEEDASDKTRVRGPMPFLSFQSLDVISPSIKAESKDGAAPEMAKPFPSLSGIAALSKPKETKEDKDNNSSAFASSANPSPNISSLFSNIRKDETASKDEKLDDSRLPRPSGIPRFAGLRSMASSSVLKSVQQEGAKSSSQISKPVFNAAAELNKKTPEEEASVQKESTDNSGRDTDTSTIPDISKDSDKNSRESASEERDLSAASQSVPEPATSMPSASEAVASESDESALPSIDLGCIEPEDDPSLEIPIPTSQTSDSDASSSTSDMELDDIDLDEEVSVVRAVPLMDELRGASDDEPKSKETSQTDEKVPADLAQVPEVLIATTESAKPEENSQHLTDDNLNDADAIQLESIDVDMADAAELGDEAQRVVSASEMLSMVHQSTVTENVTSEEAEKEYPVEIEAIDLDEPTRVSAQDAIAGAEGLFTAGDIELDTGEDSGVAKAKVPHHQLDDLEARYADLFKESEEQDKNLAEEASVSEASQLIQLEHLMKVQKKESRKSWLLIAVVVGLILIVVGAIAYDSMVKEEKKDNAVMLNQPTFNQTGGRAITSDELDEFVPNDEFEIIEVEPTPEHRSHRSRNSGNSNTNAPSGTQEAMEALYGSQDDNVDAPVEQPVVKQDGRANVVLQKADDFANTDAVQGSKYSIGNTNSRDAFKIGLKMVSVTVGECFRREAKNGNLNVDKVRLRLTVQPEGNVSEFKVLEDVPESFNNCLEAKRDRWKFAPFSGSAVTMTQSFVRG